MAYHSDIAAVPATPAATPRSTAGISGWSFGRDSILKRCSDDERTRSLAPTILNTFLEAYDFTGKTIVLFATSGGSGLGKSASGLRPSAPGAKIVDGRMLNGRLNETELRHWAEGLKL